MDIRPEFKKKTIRSYVIRAGRITEGQKLAFEQYWPTLGLSLYDGKIALATVFDSDQPLVVEVGFGMGDSLLTMAQQEPDKNFIGIEVHSPGVGRLVNGAGVSGVENLRVYMADALDVLEDCLPDQSVSRFQLYFPDPWHKKKHQKRRIVQQPLLNLLQKKMAVGGVIHFATDWQHYAEKMLALMEQQSWLENCAGDGYSEKPGYRPATKFERRGEGLGHGVWDMLYRVLPDVAC